MAHDASIPIATTRARTVVPAIFAAIAFAVGAWAWWVSHDRINGTLRPHFPIWDYVCHAQAARGVPYPTGVIYRPPNPLISGAVNITGRWGYSLAAIAAIQLPFLVALVVASAFIAWRLAGPFAAALSAWLAALAPMTVGLSVNFDDLLMLQACAATAAALWLWSWHRRLWPLGFLSVFPVVFAIRAAVYFSNGLTFLGVVGFAGGGAILWAWISWWKNRHGQDPRALPPIEWTGSIRVLAKSLGRRWSFSRTPWVLTLSVIVAGAGGVAAAWPIPTGYLFAQNAMPSFQHLSTAHNPAAIRATVSLWFAYLAGPALTAVCAISIGIAAWRRRLLAALPLLAWLFLPLALFTIVTKRHEFYLVSAAPATYPLAAIGFSMIATPRRRIAASVAACVAVAAGFALAIRSDIPETPPYRLRELFESVPKPYLYAPDARLMILNDAAGKRVAKICAARNLPINALARIPGDIGAVGVAIWRNAPDLPLGDVQTGPFFPGRHCLVIDIGTERRPPKLHRYLTAYLRESAPRAPDAARGELIARVEGIRAHSGEYEFVFAERGWALHIFDPAGAGNE
ncbi:hypothetical protein K8I61_02955 [bacterium]|nr:hypothetical protein [bacterium]